MVPPEGLEPPTLGFVDQCSSPTELKRFNSWFRGLARQGESMNRYWSIGLDSNQRIESFADSAIRPLWYRCILIFFVKLT